MRLAKVVREEEREAMNFFLRNRAVMHRNAVQYALGFKESSMLFRHPVSLESNIVWQSTD